MWIRVLLLKRETRNCLTPFSVSSVPSVVKTLSLLPLLLKLETRNAKLETGFKTRNEKRETKNRFS
ncbi:MAG: hypothetical protein JWO20_2513 [Candidatus Angelobacter sp.]|nr:hypothetical protein [Candidatus Angelobacter sp.]